MKIILADFDLMLSVTMHSATTHIMQNKKSALLFLLLDIFLKTPHSPDIKNCFYYIKKISFLLDTFQSYITFLSISQSIITAEDF